MDRLYEYIENKNVSKEEIVTIKKKLDDEEYDSDSIKQDIFEGYLNIKIILNNDIQSNLFHQYIHPIKR